MFAPDRWVEPSKSAQIGHIQQPDTRLSQLHRPLFNTTPLHQGADPVLLINTPAPAPNVDEVFEYAAPVSLLPVNDKELVGYTARIDLPPVRLGKGTEHDLLMVLPLVENKEDPVLAINTPTPVPDAEELFEDTVLVLVLPTTDDEVTPARKTKSQLKRHRRRGREAADSEKMAALALSLVEIGSLLPIEPQVMDCERLIASLGADDSDPGLDSVLDKKKYWRERYDKEPPARRDDFRRLSIDALLLASPRALPTDGARTEQHLHLDLARCDPTFLTLLVSVRGRCPLPDNAEMAIPFYDTAKSEPASQDDVEVTRESLLEEGSEAFLHDFAPTSSVVTRTKAQKRTDLKRRQREEATPATDTAAADLFTVLEAEEGLGWATGCDAAGALQASQSIDADAPSQHLTATQQRNQRRRNKERAERRTEDTQSSEGSSSQSHSSNKKSKKKSGGKKKPGSSRPVYGIHLQP
ncbi:hypothetical protein CONPUDRAFT_165702 [Coniophora puteana RWD-64-598 SS2]|uniref:Uncharacterized protein n=1 Tax=Coniophora puteana (strain RWD-64-598) TaxID=741705 RepID=A0A5M3MR93_CONPW|nr:uncharacterized protein CONPUDRAFT_165702 [Coniophora puteana RWD-64-598 SS2]EIW81600.1 hypothetical protein CONPUDRAFT_165702 [Coniophora puteana RWD-64-598 SS2]